MTDKLTNFGHTFQVKSIACLMKNQSFLEQIHDILDESNYDSDSLKWIIKECQKSWKFDCEVLKSLTDENSIIIKINNLKKK